MKYLRQSVKMPIFIGGRRGLIKAAAVQGSAPLLVSRPALRALQAKSDFDKDEMLVLHDQLRIPLETNAAGQFVLNVMESPKNQSSAEVLMSSASAPDDQLDAPEDSQLLHELSLEVEIQPCPECPEPPQQLVIQSREDYGLTKVPVYLPVGDSKFWKYVVKRVVYDG